MGILAGALKTPSGMCSGGIKIRCWITYGRTNFFLVLVVRGKGPQIKQEIEQKLKTRASKSYIRNLRRDKILDTRSTTPAILAAMIIENSHQEKISYNLLRGLNGVLLSSRQIGPDIKGYKWEIVQILGSIRCTANVWRKSNVNRNTEWNKSLLIKISHSLVILLKLERKDFKGVTSIHESRGERDREHSFLWGEWNLLLLCFISVLQWWL